MIAGYIYETTNLINGKTYIGQHKKDEFDIHYRGSGKLITQAISRSVSYTHLTLPTKA